MKDKIQRLNWFLPSELNNDIKYTLLDKVGRFLIISLTQVFRSFSVAVDIHFLLPSSNYIVWLNELLEFFSFSFVQ